MSSSAKTSPHYSLSRYFPKGTEYFYGYPAQEDSHFFNGVAPEIEELVAARTIIAAGPDVKPICFHASVEPFVWGLLEDLGVIKMSKKDLIVLPKEINVQMKGAERNKKLKQALTELTHTKKLVMAQPYLDVRLKEKYAIPSHRILWLNDKRNLASFIPNPYVPVHHDEFLDGQCFEEFSGQLPLPCVIKVSSSSSGDGVRICRTEEDVQRAKEDFAKLENTILVTEFVDIVNNFGVNFGVPEDSNAPAEIISWHEQLTDKKGCFVGGIIEQNQTKEPFKTLSKVVLEKILPEVRRKGWFGSGGFDILMNAEGRFYFVDPNMRMTGMTVYDFLVRNGTIKKNLLRFMGSFKGTRKEFTKIITPLAKVGSAKQKLYITTLTEHDGLFRFDAALLYDKRSEIPALAKEMMAEGIESSVLTSFLA